jgi:hypothetical protein
MPGYDSGAQKQSEWRDDAASRIASVWRGLPATSAEITTAVRRCVEFQKAIGVEGVILPSPLTRDHSTDYSREVEWLETGLQQAHDLCPDLPAYASIALSDTCLRGFSPNSNTLIDLILDQVTARASDGAYIVLEQANESTYNITSANTVGAILRLVRGLKAGGLKRVIVSYVGTAGLLTLVAGADAWATGWYRGERRLRLSDIEQSEGRAMPAYYSHPAATEFHLAQDLTSVRDAGLLSTIADATSHSHALLVALNQGRTPADVGPWRPTQSNVTAARSHYATAMIRETRTIAALENDVLDYGRAWLDGAVARAQQLYQLGDFNPRTELDHQRAWRDALSVLD